MKRIQLFEFEDFGWLPSVIRSGMTKLIVVLHKMMGTRELLSSLLIGLHQKYPYQRIVDLGSGSGGIMPETLALLRKEINENVSLLLTDIHPNREFVENFNKSNPDHIKYQSESLDATNLQAVPQGLKTMVNSFHHMPREKAQMILKSASDNREPILIYEIAENKMPILLWIILLPISLTIVFIMALLMTPFTKPLRPSQLLFTYLIPIIPLLYAWDGQASLPRMYAYDDLEDMLSKIPSEYYEWEVKPARKSNGKTIGYYIQGLPK